LELFTIKHFYYGAGRPTVWKTVKFQQPSLPIQREWDARESSFLSCMIRHKL